MNVPSGLTRARARPSLRNSDRLAARARHRAQVLDTQVAAPAWDVRALSRPRATRSSLVLVESRSSASGPTLGQCRCSAPQPKLVRNHGKSPPVRSGPEGEAQASWSIDWNYSSLLASLPVSGGPSWPTVFSVTSRVGWMMAGPWPRVYDFEAHQTATVGGVIADRVAPVSGGGEARKDEFCSGPAEKVCSGLTRLGEVLRTLQI